MLKQQIDQDLKAALLAGDKTLVMTLRGLKSAILYVEVAKGARDEGLPDEEIITILTKEAKKRQESAELYEKGGDSERAQAEISEKKVIDAYLPQQLSDAELQTIIEAAMNDLQASTTQEMGQVIGKVKAKAGARAEGARIARMVKERLS